MGSFRPQVPKKSKKRRKKAKKKRENHDAGKARQSASKARQVKIGGFTARGPGGSFHQESMGSGQKKEF